MALNVITATKERVHQLPRYGALPALLPIAVAVVSSVTLLLLVQTSGITTTGYDVKRLELDRNDWRQLNYQLQAEVSRLNSLDRIEKDAKSRLRMVPTTEYVFVTASEPPASASRGLSSLGQAKETKVLRNDEGWSQQFLDWLGMVLGFR